MRLKTALANLALLLAACSARAQFATTINDNSTTPAPPTGTLNAVPQKTNGYPVTQVSHYVLYPTVQVACPSSGDLSVPVLTAYGALPNLQGGIVDARRCTGATTWTNDFEFNIPDTVLLLPCATLTTSRQISVMPGIRNVRIQGCAYEGGSSASGTAGGTVFDYTGTGTFLEVGDVTFSTDTTGFALADLLINTASAGTAAVAIQLDRVQEANIERIYLIGANTATQTGLSLDGQGNYTGGSFIGVHINGFGVPLFMSGDNTGAANASTFVRLHANCSTSGGSPISGTIGVDLAYGDGNMFTGGDVEGCDTMLLLGAGAKNNTFTGLRNENSNAQVLAMSGSANNLWLTGGTMFTGKLTDSGTRNTFLDAFHRVFNTLNGDQWHAQADATVVDHAYTGIGLGTVRGYQQEYTTDVPGSPGNYQNAWLWGPGDGATGLQVWVLQDLLNNVPRFGINQYTTAGGNDTSYINAAGTGYVCFNCSANSGTGGVIFDSGGSSPTEVGAIDSTGALTLYGNMKFYANSAYQWYLQCASASVCSLTNPATSGNPHAFDVYPAGQFNLNSGGTSAVTVNNTSAAGTGGFIVYEGGTNSGTAAFTVSGTGSITAIANAQIGNASGTGNLTIGNHLNQLGTGDFGGSCAMSSSTTCYVSLQHSYSTAICFAADQTGNVDTVRAYYSGAHCNVVAASSNSDTWGCICIGNPS